MGNKNSKFAKLVLELAENYEKSLYLDYRNTRFGGHIATAYFITKSYEGLQTFSPKKSKPLFLNWLKFLGTIGNYMYFQMENNSN